MPVAQSHPSHDLLDDAPCGYLVLNEAGRIAAVNGTLAGWLGSSARELEGKPAHAIFSRTAHILFETSLLPLLQLRGRVEEVSLDLVAKDGSKIPVLFSADSKADPSGSRLTRIAFLRASARRDFERALITARTAAETSLTLEQVQGELREQFVAVLGHDLRNPVASISAATRMLSHEPLSEQGTEIIHLMQGTVQRMSRLIDNVLDFARNRLGGGIDLSTTGDEPLEPLIRQAIDELRAVQPDRQVHTELSVQHPVQCDAGRIGQMVSNLLGNALTHGDPTRPVRIHASTSEDGKFELWVSNHGTPIPAASMARLFEPFVRGGHEGNTQGLGLGLHIASEIAKAHGGVFDVTSDEEETRFTFRMNHGQRTA
ncbi:ATP-binding protein (plasmid) [Paracoccus marcusii]|uniref:PAS domain-containing sensor histidine kinase n=1 Tax=Paracoccus TaxID=265 RepID=UPI001890B837|nr:MULTISPECIES: PAS domain-containing sensor histidine kinase [Paracoccus]MBF5080054.1 PAS domain-containing sensor histidine kinase [Paracoccus sp. NBH48]QXI65840.1 Bacteriophytochrome [Paracoccus marcusii]